MTGLLPWATAMPATEAAVAQRTNAEMQEASAVGCRSDETAQQRPSFKHGSSVMQLPSDDSRYPP